MLITLPSRRLTFTVNLVHLIILLAFHSVVSHQFDPINTSFDHDVSLAEETSLKEDTYELASGINDFPFKDETGVDMDQTSTLPDVVEEEDKVNKVDTSITSDQTLSKDSTTTLKSVKYLVHGDHSLEDSKENKEPSNQEVGSTENVTTTPGPETSTLNSNNSLNNSVLKVNNLLSSSICFLVGNIFCNHTLICRGSGDIDCDTTNELLAEDDPQKNQCKISDSLNCVPLPLNIFCSGRANCRQKTSAFLEILNLRGFGTPSIVLLLLLTVVVVAVLIKKGLIKPAKLKLRSNNEIVPSKQA